MNKDHHEIHFEDYVTAKLVTQGWLEGTREHYDQQRALYPEDVIGWITDTQPDVITKLTALHGAAAQEQLLDRLEKCLQSSTGGTMNVLRGGFKFTGAGHIDMSQKAPEDLRNNKVNQRYQKNRLRVVRQLKYCPTREWAIDLVFFINGLPVATVELKTDFTQSVEAAMTQYKLDRLPVDPVTGRKEPLLTFKRGAVVHFAMSDSEIQMTTQLNGEKTFFLPFNKGNNGHAGNAPRTDGEYPVAYMWEEVLQPQAWLRIFHSFVYVETTQKVNAKGMPYTKETQIFPRYHQFEAVNQMIADARQGAGRNYLCEHSAGSGKTSTIAWTAHDLICLRSEEGEALFNSVIIVTDRTVLDAQLQEAVQQLDHQHGVICAIDRQKSNLSKSKQLAEALMKGTPIIVVTIQTFPYAMEAIITEKSLATRKFAVIIDEAHTSQTGANAQGLRAALSLDAKARMEEMTVDDLLLELQKSRVMPDNISHFAFTATPKHSTMTLFGRLEYPGKAASDNNKPRSFHRYTMRQAIEEGFILDVLENYMPYSVAVKLNQSLEKDKRVDKKYARRSLAKWISLHPTNVGQKVDFIVKHFKDNVAPLLNGEAKAMIVTSSRASAVKYKLVLDDYIQKKGITGVKALVAFSGKVPAKDLGDIKGLKVDEKAEFSEANMNLLGSVDIRNAFDTNDYNIMLVANKFQTGFNQPKLVAMYVDKKISGIEAVQTLSRLNRTYAGKDKTFVIDFVNEAETILAAFKQYDAGAELEKVQDTDVVYDMQSILDGAQIYNSLDLAAFKKARDKSLSTGVSSDVHKKLYAAIQRPTDVFNAKLKNLTDSITQLDKLIDQAYEKDDKTAQKQLEHKRSEFAKQREALMRFKTDLSRFVRVYNYIAQLVNFGDAELENFAAFCQLLAKRLKGVSPEDIDLSGLLMAGYEIKATSQTGGNEEKKPETLKPITSNEAEASDREKQFLSEIIKRLNDLFGDTAPADDQQHFANQVAAHTTKNELVVEQIQKNTKEQTMNGDLPKVVTQSVIQAMTSHAAIANVLLKDKQVMDDFVGIVYDLVKTGHSNNAMQE